MDVDRTAAVAAVLILEIVEVIRGSNIGRSRAE
jgi:hypothetical protein